MAATRRPTSPLSARTGGCWRPSVAGRCPIRPSASRRGWSGWRCSWRSGPGQGGTRGGWPCRRGGLHARRRRHATRRATADDALASRAFARTEVPATMRSGSSGAGPIGAGAWRSSAARGRRPRRDRRADRPSRRAGRIQRGLGRRHGRRLGRGGGRGPRSRRARAADVARPDRARAQGLRSPEALTAALYDGRIPVGARARAHRSPSRRPSMVTLSRAGSSTASPTRSSRWPGR